MSISQRLDRLEKVLDRCDESERAKESTRRTSELFRELLVADGGLTQDEVNAIPDDQLAEVSRNNRDVVDFFISRCEMYAFTANHAKPKIKLWIVACARFVVEAFEKNPTWGPCRLDIVNLSNKDFRDCKFEAQQAE